MKIYEWTVIPEWLVIDDYVDEYVQSRARSKELIDWFESLMDSRIEFDKMKPRTQMPYHLGSLFAGMPGLDKQKGELTMGSHRFVRPQPVDWDAAAAMGLDERPQSVGSHPIRGTTIHMAVIDDVTFEPASPSERFDGGDGSNDRGDIGNAGQVYQVEQRRIEGHGNASRMQVLSR